jgi:hypothetical protein
MLEPGNTTDSEPAATQSEEVRATPKNATNLDVRRVVADTILEQAQWIKVAKAVNARVHTFCFDKAILQFAEGQGVKWEGQYVKYPGVGIITICEPAAAPPMGPEAPDDGTRSL